MDATLDLKRWVASVSSAVATIQSTTKSVVEFVSSPFCLAHDSLLTQILWTTGEDLDGVRPLYVKRFCAIARAHRSLQTIVWTPTAEVTWVWTFFRNGDKLTFKEKATIDYDQGPQADVPQSAVLMLA